MPLKLNVGLSRKVGEPNYGSRGASVNLEIELDSQLVADPAKLQERIRQCFNVVRTSLDEEMAGNGHEGSNPACTKSPNGDGVGYRTTQVTTPRDNGSRPATPAQVKAIYAIARGQGIDLAPYLHEKFGVGQPAALSIKAASQAIDELKAMRALVSS